MLAIRDKNRTKLEVESSGSGDLDHTASQDGHVILVGGSARACGC